ncbi:MAG: Hsp70 family protein [Proteobacteria bacterium]|nr:Hsp70 family protein [Pseudomonadota bacterium]
MATRVYGIDLGTTYSCISYCDESGRPVVVPNAEGELTTPSVVFFENPSNVVVGVQAKNASKVEPERVAAFVKRSMGDGSYRFNVDGREHTPEEISSLVLRKVVGDAAQALGEPITDVVITCPAYFGNNEREATRNAGKLAGLNVRHILNEPTAAAICYGLINAGVEKTVLVYDLGGGTFDITVIAIKEKSIEVVCTGGNFRLGGKDWDDRIIDYFAQAFVERHPDIGDPRDDPYAFQELVTAAEACKKGLSTKDRWPQMVVHGGVRERVELTREKFEEITADLLEQTVELTRNVLEQAKERGYSRIDQVLLVGGSSKMPAVAKRLGEVFGIESQLFEPDLAVAKGAALMGVRLVAGELLREAIAADRGGQAADVDLEQVDRKTLEDVARKVAADGGRVLRLPGKELADYASTRVRNVSSKAFGVAIVDDRDNDKVAHLIGANTPLPAEHLETGFGTRVANQVTVRLRVMEQAGEVASSVFEDNRLIGDGELTGLPQPLPAGAPIHVKFRLREDGTLEVMGFEPNSKREVTFQIKVDGILSDEEVAERRSDLMQIQVS